MTSGQLLKSLREQAGMTQQDVADKLNLTRAAYQKIEADIVSPRQKILEITKIFNISADTVLGLQPPPALILTENEKNIIEKIRQLPIYKQVWLNQFLTHYFSFELDGETNKSDGKTNKKKL